MVVLDPHQVSLWPDLMVIELLVHGVCLFFFRYQDQISSVTLDGVSEKHYHLAEKLLSFNFPAETEWLK